MREEKKNLLIYAPNLRNVFAAAAAAKVLWCYSWYNELRTNESTIIIYRYVPITINLSECAIHTYVYNNMLHIILYIFVCVYNI